MSDSVSVFMIVRGCHAGVRHGLMVVGPTGGGKSSNVRTLQRALTMLKNDKIEGIKYEKVDIHHLNPKSITMGQLCARRVLRCFHFIDATRVRLTMPGVVSFLRKRPFGPTS